MPPPLASTLLRCAVSVVDWTWWLTLTAGADWDSA